MWWWIGWNQIFKIRFWFAVNWTLDYLFGDEQLRSIWRYKRILNIKSVITTLNTQTIHIHAKKKQIIKWHEQEMSKNQIVYKDRKYKWGIPTIWTIPFLMNESIDWFKSKVFFTLFFCFLPSSHLFFLIFKSHASKEQRDSIAHIVISVN